MQAAEKTSKRQNIWWNMKDETKLVESLRLRSGNALYVSECPVKHIPDAKRMLSLLLSKEGERVLYGVCTVTFTEDKRPITSVSFNHVIMLYSFLVETVNAHDYDMDFFDEVWMVSKKIQKRNIFCQLKVYRWFRNFFMPQGQGFFAKSLFTAT